VAALPGSLYVYQGDELGLPEVETLAPAERRDPIFALRGGTDPGRDGCRVPLPWSGTVAPYGFAPTGTSTWLPQPPADWASLTVAAPACDEASMLSRYRSALALRRRLGRGDAGDAAGRGGGVGVGEHFAWLDLGPGVLAFARGAWACAVNLSAAPVGRPSGEVLLASGPLADEILPVDTAVWWRYTR
jgi:alpha-glucosidase